MRAKGIKAKKIEGNISRSHLISKVTDLRVVSCTSLSPKPILFDIT